VINDDEQFVRLRRIVHKAKRKPCRDCGEFKPEEMTYDHLPTMEPKSFNIGSAGYEFDVPKSLLIAEIRKCEVVCRKCHDKRELERDTLRCAIARPFEILSLLSRATPKVPKVDSGAVMRGIAVMRRLVGGDAVEAERDRQRTEAARIKNNIDEWNLSFLRGVVYLQMQEKIKRGKDRS
jgi:hypothetical protein